MRVGLCLVLVAGLSGMGGCWYFGEPRVKSPISGVEVTQAELRAEHEAAQQRAKADAKAEAEKAASEAQRKAEALAAEDQAERERIEAEARAAKREFDAAVAGADLASQQALLELRSRFDARADEIAALAAKQNREREYKAGLIRSDLSATLAQITSSTQAALDALRTEVSKADVRFAQIAEKTALIDQGVSGMSPIIAGLLGTVPGGSIVATLWGTVAARAAKRQAEREKQIAAEIREREDKAWQEAKAEKEQEVAIRDANYDAGAQQAVMANVMQLLAQLPALQTIRPATAPGAQPASAGA